ncbi:MAG: CoA transferase [Acidimicrobiales bacterium]|nr:CoA transferase [Acidimicrobiales bacterium]
MTADTPRRPLDGIRVLDVSRVVSGPVCCFYLASLGAEVIRIEPLGGDVSWLTPPWVAPDGAIAGSRTADTIGISALRKHRGKRSVVLDLTVERGVEVMHRLVRTADVLVENFRPGIAAKHGVDYDTLRAINPRLVQASITGFGQDGPYRDRPSMDLVIQAMSGLMAKTGFEDGPPTKSGATFGDQLPALFATVGILAALRQRDIDGEGQWIDVAMLDSLVTALWDEPLDSYAERGVPERVGNSDPRGAPLDAYPTSDGWIAVVCTTDKHAAAMFDLIGRDDLVERGSNHAKRADLRDEINDAVRAWTATRPTAEVEQAFLDRRIPCGPVEGAYSAGEHPQVRHRGTLTELRHPAADEPTHYLGPVLPVHLSRTEVSTTPAETLGHSTEAVLRELAGCTDDELADLRADGVI